MNDLKKSKEELEVIRFAQKRLAWIDNVMRIQRMTREEAEAAWTKLYNENKKPSSQPA